MKLFVGVQAQETLFRGEGMGYFLGLMGLMQAAWGASKLELEVKIECSGVPHTQFRQRQTPKLEIRTWTETLRFCTDGNDSDDRLTDPNHLKRVCQHSFERQFPKSAPFTVTQTLVGQTLFLGPCLSKN